MAKVDIIQFLTQDEMRRLLGAIDNKCAYALFLIAYRHGLRASEVGMLQVDDVELKRGRIHIHRFKGSLSGVHPMRRCASTSWDSLYQSRSDNESHPAQIPDPVRKPIARGANEYVVLGHVEPAR